MTDAENVLKNLERLGSDLGDLQKRASEFQQEYLARLAIPAGGPVSITFEESGLIGMVHFDRNKCRNIDPRDLGQEINLALYRGRDSGNEELADARPSVQINVDAVDRSAFLVAAELRAEKKFSNPRKTVIVTAANGTISRIACEDSWLATESFQVIERDIAQTARRAMLETDVFSRFSNSELGNRDGFQ